MNKIASATTKLYGIIGSPILHSKSPILHNYAFSRCNIDAVFLAFEANKQNLEKVMNGIRILNFSGGSVTMPIKHAVVPLMDELSHEAELIGAVNVFKSENGILKGYNTDGIGLVTLLDKKEIEYKNKKIVMCGAGGAGRSVAIQLALSGVRELVIFDIIKDNADQVVNIINNNIPNCFARGYVSDETQLIEELNDDTSAYVDCSPLGMSPHENTTMIHDFTQVPKTVTFVDITYAPPKTKLLQLAEKNGNKIYNGMDMFYYQGAEAFRIWTGEELPIDDIKKLMS